MTKNDLQSGMIVKLTTGPETYETTKWSSLVRVISVNRANGKVSGMQYIQLAVRNNKCPTHLQFTNTYTILSIQNKFDEWWDTFNGEILG